MILQRTEGGLAWLGLMFLVSGSLLTGPRMGIIGESVSQGLHAVAGDAAWLLPVWLFDVSRRSFVGCQRSVMRAVRWLLLITLAAVTLALLGAAGGWIGVGLSSILAQAIGAGAAMLVIGTWVVLALRLLGQERVHVIAGHATTMSRHALAQYRPSIRPTLPARGDVIDTVGETMVPPPLPVPAPPVPAPSVQPPPLPSSIAPARAVVRKPSSWSLPNVELLQEPTPVQIDGAYRDAVAKNLGERLRHFNINATVAVSSQQGAVVSRYEITPGASQGLKPIMARDEDLQAAYMGLRFVPKHGTGKLGVEIPVPDAQRGTIALRTVLDSPAWTDADAVLPLALGVTSAGDPVVIDLADTRGPHLLAAGTSGSGKSVGVTAMVISLLLRNSPDELQLIIIDPKVVEFAAFAGLPHLLTPPITELNAAVERLLWAVDEMERRYRQFVERGAKNIDSYNERVKTHERLPRIVIVVDEYADLSAIAKNQVEPCIQRLAQKARAAGIHMILATQRPSVDVITGVIKANFNARIAYKTAQREDSKTIIGNTGAYTLLGKGDSLCLIPQYSTELTRVHGAYISEEEVDAICQAWTSQATGEERRVPPALPSAASTVVADPAEPRAPTPAPKSAPAPERNTPKFAPLISTTGASNDRYQQAIELARSEGTASQRMFTEGLHCSTIVAKRLFSRMRDEGLIRPGGKNNTYIFCGGDAASMEE